MKKMDGMGGGNHRQPYDDIIGLPRHISAKRAGMSLYDRAAQFAPFAALTGYDAIVRETARLTDGCIDLTECSQAALNEKLGMVLEAIPAHPVITVTYFQPDERKAGGAYLSRTGAVKKLDSYGRTLMLEDGTVIAISRIVELEGELFP